MSGKPVEDSFLKNSRLKMVFDRLKNMLSIRLNVDAGILKGSFSNFAIDCSSTAEPVEVIQQSNNQQNQKQKYEKD